MARVESMDLVDVVDTEDRVIGRQPRQVLLDNAYSFRTTHVLVLDTPSSILLQRIGSDGTRHPGRWGSSAAAYLHAGESYEEASRRRLREELGLELPLHGFFKIRMRDQLSVKFVGVWLAHRHNEPLNIDYGHIAAVAPFTFGEIDRDLAADAEQFTRTFQLVYQHMRRTQF